MTRIPLIFTLVLLVGCADNEYRSDRIDGPQVTTLAFKFDDIQGVRDGASVNAEARFTDGADFSNDEHRYQPLSRCSVLLSEQKKGQQNALILPPRCTCHCIESSKSESLCG